MAAFDRSAFDTNAFSESAFDFGASSTPTATPGFLGRTEELDKRRRYETDAEKLERRVREGTLPAQFRPDTDADLYAKESARLALGIQRFRADAEASRLAIQAIEAALLELSTEALRRDLLHAQQALQLAKVREAVLLEEMEVLDIAFFAVTLMMARCQ